MSELSKRRSKARDVVVAVTQQTPIRIVNQRHDNTRQGSGDNGSHSVYDKPKVNGVANNEASNPRASPSQAVTRSKSSQASFKSDNRGGRLETQQRKPSYDQVSILRKHSCDQNLPTISVPRARNLPVRPHSGYVMHRAEGMFDLSNIHLNPDHRGSVCDLLDEFQKQMDLSKTKKEKVLDVAEGAHSMENGERMYHKNRELNRVSPAPVGFTNETITRPRNTQSQPMEEHDNHASSLGARSRGANRVTTDSEEELLTQILLSMSRSATAVEKQADDESDYANLWDSESGSSGPSFQANQDVMGSLMRKKVRHQCSNDSDRRKAFISSVHSDSSSTSSPSNTFQFDMDKFKSLQEKAENMDLTLTDFFADLKHSSSIMELSKLFSSTQKLAANDCKFKCHQNCEDLIHDQCAGPKTEPVDTDCWATSKHLRHDADDADSGYSGSGGSAGFTLTKEEICSKIDAYNKSVGKSTGAMTLPSDVDDSFQGSIKVCVCIDRPINMSLSSRPTSIYEVLHRESELSPPSSPHNTVTHEQLPKNAVVSLHTNSSNTASEVVTILLNKFKITDNPKSFALFEQTIQNEKEVKLRKVGDQERPLLNYLRWITECNESKRFVLKENDSGDIMYEAFSIPELNNFLRVLEQEEATKLTDIQNKYQVRRKQLADRLRELDLERSTDRRSLTTAR